MKVVPLGQIAGQRLLAALSRQLVEIAQARVATDDET